MTLDSVPAYASAIAAVAVASAAWLMAMLLWRRSILVADLLMRDKFLDLVIRNIGRGVAYEVVFSTSQTPSAALKGFTESSLLRYGLSVLTPGREYRVPLLSLTEEARGKGFESEDPLVLQVAYQRRGVILRRRCRETFEQRMGAFSDAMHIRAAGMEWIEWAS